jgi:hypothetical protein
MKSILLFVAVVLKGTLEAIIAFWPIILIGFALAFLSLSLGDLFFVVLLVGYGLYKMGLLNPLLDIWDTHKRQSFKNIAFYYRCKFENPSLLLSNYKDSFEDVLISINKAGECFISFVDVYGVVSTKGKSMSLGDITKYVATQLSNKPENKAIISVDADVDFDSVLSLMTFLQKNGVDNIGLHFKSI